MPTHDILIEETQGAIDAANAVELSDDELTSIGVADAKKFAALEMARRQLEQALKRVETQVNAMREPLWSAMCEAGVTNMKVGELTLYGRMSYVVNKRSQKDGVTTEMVCNALRNVGRDDMVSDGYNAASLKAYIKELMENEEEIPEELRRLLYIEAKPKLVTSL